VNNVNVIDASAILAYLQRERGEDVVEVALDAGTCWITAVNYCEVLGKLREKGMPSSDAQSAIADLGLSIIDFDIELARYAAELRAKTFAIGASLGDRACLALAEKFAGEKTDAVVFTAEQSWARVKWPFKVVVIRSAKTAP